MPSTIDRATSLLKESFAEWRDDDALQWAAALSYYAILALAPLLVLLLGLASLAYAEPEAQRRLLGRIGGWTGDPGVAVAETILESDRADSIWASATGFLFLVFGATGVFAQLQNALNRIWDVEADDEGVRGIVRSRLLAFVVVLGIGAIVLASVGARAVVANLPTPDPATRGLEVGLSIGVLAAALATTYKVLPDVVIAWRDVVVGALVTAVFLYLGQIGIGFYLGRSALTSAYGAAGSLVALLVWLYYSAAIFFFGAEFTEVWARRSGRALRADGDARKVEGGGPGS